MFKLTQFILTLVLMIAIPVQGFAVVAMSLCMPSHHGVQVISQQRGLDHLAVQHHYAPMKLTTKTQNGDLTPDLGALKKFGKLTDGQCSTCASFCAGGTSIVNTDAVTHSTEITKSKVIPFAQVSFISHIPQGLDPPPRSVLT